jgi:hydrogenase expression/formation protein HypE
LAWLKLWRRITLAHGSGGRETHELIEQLVVKLVPEQFRSVRGGWGLDVLDDAALIPIGGDRYLAVTVDAYTVKPVFFPGGDLGKLAASGTINDLLMVGARPLAALDAVVVEEGFPTDDLYKVLSSLVETLTSAGVALVGGDFKVVPRGEVDGILVLMAGLGIVEGKPILDTGLRPGDRIVVSGPVGDHGAAILSARYGLAGGAKVESDVKPLTDLMIPLLEKYRGYIHAAGDPTRGGLAMLLNDWAKKAGVVIVVDESRIPVREEVRAYAELLGIEPLALASEGVAVLAVDPYAVDDIVEAMRRLGYAEARVVGEVREAPEERFRGTVLLRTVAGGFRVLEPPSGELVPRIC